jgi:hypothetical protein
LPANTGRGADVGTIAGIGTGDVFVARPLAGTFSIKCGTILIGTGKRVEQGLGA